MTTTVTGFHGVMIQTSAMLVDAYRELHHKKLFWITLMLSLLVVVAFAFVGINDVGITIFRWTIPGLWNTRFIPRETFYNFLFINFAIPVWLGLIATILALVSVGGMFPDMLGSGAIDLYLAKPISRARLFLTKYCTGLLFAAMQVLVFSMASFLVIGFRGGSWEWGIFLAVPLVTLFFSYLFCVCVLLGVLTRSALASILITMLLWGMLYLVNVSDALLLSFRVGAEYEVTQKQRLIDSNQKLIDTNTALPEDRRSNMSGFEFQLAKHKEEMPGVERNAKMLRMWHGIVYWIKTPLPKTGETVALMDRWLVDPDPFFAVDEQESANREERRAKRRAATGPNAPQQQSHDAPFNLESPQVKRKIQEELESRSVVWVIGTSLGFEAFILGIGCLIFARRDF